MASSVIRISFNLIRRRKHKSNNNNAVTRHDVFLQVLIKGNPDKTHE